MSGDSFATVAQITSASWLSSDAKPFLSAILTTAQTRDPQCSWELYVDGYRVNDLITGGMFGCGGDMQLWGKSGGVWKLIVGGQAVPECSEIRKEWSSTIPIDFFGGRCMEGGAGVAFTP